MNKRRRKKARIKYLMAAEPFDQSAPKRYRRLSRHLGLREREYIERVWLPHGVSWAAQFRLDPAFALRLLETLPERLGFAEAAWGLAPARQALVGAIWQGQTGPRRAALNRYLDLAQALADAPAEREVQERRRIGLMLAEARIWREAGEPAPWLRNLDFAYTNANNLRLVGYVVVIGTVLNAYWGTGELLQAEERYDEAVSAYIDRESVRGLSDRDRGLLNLRLAECYRELLEADPADLQLRDLLGGSIQSALAYLEGELEELKALGLLGEIGV